MSAPTIPDNPKYEPISGTTGVILISVIFFIIFVAIIVNVILTVYRCKILAKSLEKGDTGTSMLLATPELGTALSGFHAH